MGSCGDSLVSFGRLRLPEAEPGAKISSPSPPSSVRPDGILDPDPRVGESV